MLIALKKHLPFNGVGFPLSTCSWIGVFETYADKIEDTKFWSPSLTSTIVVLHAGFDASQTILSNCTETNPLYAVAKVSVFECVVIP